MPPGQMLPMWVSQAPLPPPPPLGDGISGPRMQTKGVTGHETYLKKLNSLFSIQPVGYVELIGISGFLKLSQKVLKLMMNISWPFNLQTPESELIGLSLYINTTPP